jgi:acyl carrier protein
MGETKPTVELFIKNFVAQLPQPVSDKITADTHFRELKDWTSLQALIIVSSFDWDYGVIIESEELRNAVTLQDLFEIITQKLLR